MSSAPIAVNAVHLLLVAPFFIWLGVTQGREMTKLGYDLLIAVGILIALYHAYRIYQKYSPSASSFYYDGYY